MQKKITLLVSAIVMGGVALALSESAMAGGYEPPVRCVMPSITYGPVRPGETLISIAKSLYPNGNPAKVAGALLKKNASAFDSGKNPIPGKILRVPTCQEIENATPLTVAPAREGAIKAAKKLPVKTATSVKDSQKTPSAPALEERLPGVGVAPGAKYMGSAEVKTFRVDENSVVRATISKNYINRISTPFRDPVVVDASGWNLTKQGNSLYVVPKGDRAQAFYITGGKGDPTISVVLVPKEGALPQTIILQLDKPNANVQLSKKEMKKILNPESYSGRIQAVFKRAALNQVIPGYTKSSVKRMIARTNDLLIVPERRYSGRLDDVFVYWIENSVDHPVKLDEASFYEDGVKAIAFYPKTTIQPGEGTRMIIMSQKTKVAK